LTNHACCRCCCRLLKRLRDEEGSRFQGQPVLHQRYVLLALLGRGGFSEVHKAYDLATLKFVAVKVRRLVGCIRLVSLCWGAQGHPSSEVHKAYDLASVKCGAVKVSS
jgi:hypothetical protein